LATVLTIDISVTVKAGPGGEDMESRWDVEEES
jgi:hypothetical protein